jgi:hypothetical protein
VDICKFLVEHGADLNSFEVLVASEDGAMGYLLQDICLLKAEAKAW